MASFPNSMNTPPNSPVKLEFFPVEGRSGHTVGRLSICRPAASNAFDASTIERLKAAISEVAKREGCRCLIVRGEGKHFSAGADLEWMKASAKLTETQNVEEARRLSALFGNLHRLPIPSLAVVQGACYGGAVGLAAACDWVIAVQGSRFCLSEVRIGVVAAVILPFIAQKIGPGALSRLVLQGRVFPAEEALQIGLVQRVVPEAGIEEALRDEVNGVLAGAASAQQVFKKLHQELREGALGDWTSQRSHMESTIARMRAAPDGQKGMAAFLSKQAPDWVTQLPADVRLFSS